MATPSACLRHALHTIHSHTSGFTPRVRRAGLLRSGLLVGATSALALSVLPGTAAAAPNDPQSLTADQLMQQMGQASHQLEIVSEQVNTAQVQLAQEQATVAGADQAAAAAQAKLGSLDGQIRQIARSAYTSGGDHLVRLDLLLTSHSANDFVSQVGTLDAIAGHANTVVSQAAQAAENAQKAQAQATKAEADAQQSLDLISGKKAQLQAQIADFQKQYATLTAPPAAPRAAPVAAAAAPSGAAQTAVNTALAQVGKPYVWGAAGPNSFDCSGLTQYAYAAAGVSLPHSASMQSTMGRPVSKDQLQPGDLVFFYTPVSHVGMYIGNGQMVHASTSGEPVKVVPLSSMPDYNSARRLVG